MYWKAVLAKTSAIAVGGRRFRVFGALRLVVGGLVAGGFLGACLVNNPAYDPTVNGPNDGSLIDGAVSVDVDGFVLVPSDAEPLPPPDAAVVALDAAVVPPPDAAVVKLDAAVVPPPDAAVVKLDAAVVPPPDAAVVKLDAAVVPPPDAAVVKLDAAVVPVPDAAVVNATCVADPSLLLCFDFENNTTKDLSSSALTVNTSSLGYEAGPSGVALRSSASTRIANANTTTLGVNAVTIQAWINPARLPSSGARFGILDYQPQYSLFVLPNGSLTCACDGTRSLTSSPVIQLGVWQSVACTMDDAAFTIWVDGVAVAKIIPNGGFCAPGVPASGLSILGNNPNADNSNPEQFEGSADNVRVWRRIRTPSELCSDSLVCKDP